MPILAKQDKDSIYACAGLQFWSSLHNRLQLVHQGSASATALDTEYVVKLLAESSSRLPENLPDESLNLISQMSEFSDIKFLMAVIFPMFCRCLMILESVLP